MLATSKGRHTGTPLRSRRIIAGWSSSLFGAREAFCARHTLTATRPACGCATTLIQATFAAVSSTESASTGPNGEIAWLRRYMGLLVTGQGKRPTGFQVPVVQPRWQLRGQSVTRRAMSQQIPDHGVVIGVCSHLQRIAWSCSRVQASVVHGRSYAIGNPCGTFASNLRRRFLKWKVAA